MCDDPMLLRDQSRHAVEQKQTLLTPEDLLSTIDTISITTVIAIVNVVVCVTSFQARVYRRVLSGRYRPTWTLLIFPPSLSFRRRESTGDC